MEYFIHRSFFEPKYCAVKMPTLPTIMSSNKLTKLVTAFCTRIGIATENTLLKKALSPKNLEKNHSCVVW